MLPIVPSSPIVRIDTGQELTFDPSDVESVKLSTPMDIIDVASPGAEFARYESGKRHIDLHITFKEGKGPKWTDATERG